MQDFASLLQSGNAWLFVPSALLLGALHGLEPGHSKTLMAAFIVTVRGTVGQAVLLGLAATVSHTAIVWIVALAGLHVGRDLNPETTEGAFQLLSAAMILAIAGWMLWRTRQGLSGCGHDHGHADDHNHDHEPHDPPGADAHARAHAADIQRRFAGRPVTNGQILAFGLTGGLIPCPASITVLLLCLQLREFTLGASLVLCFSIGLAITLVASGAFAAIGLRRATARWPALDALAARAPFASALLIALVGLYVGLQGWRALHP